MSIRTVVTFRRTPAHEAECHLVGDVIERHDTLCGKLIPYNSTVQFHNGYFSRPACEDCIAKLPRLHYQQTGLLGFLRRLWP